MIKTDIYLPIKYTEADMKNALCERLPLSFDELSEIKIVRQSLDLTEKPNIRYRVTVGISLSEDREKGLLKMKKKVSALEDYSFAVPTVALSSRPVVVGSGPCGLFAALLLSESGNAPIIIERGLPVEERAKKVDAFRKFGILDTECNIQFGEGGAGTYSDGKLKVGSLDKYKMKVLREFVSAGAGEDILYSASAHLGTDKLSDIVKNIRNRIISLGGEFVFSAKFTDLFLKDGRVSGVGYEKNGTVEKIDTESVILAIGHSAKDSFELLVSKGIPMVAKGFGIGVRIEHDREYINSLVYGKKYDKALETASYHLVTHLPNGRSVYSFCMCPGGTVVPAASEIGGVVTNGMSEYLRDGRNSNAAFLVSVTPSDFGSDYVLAGMEFQRRIEKQAFVAGGSDYKAPAVRMEDFFHKNKPTAAGSVLPTYPIGTSPVVPEEYLPDFITDSLRESISDFDDWMGGFYCPDAIITGAETRSTSPVRILRGESYEAEGAEGLYPAGEGAGYSGGIVSSATDGLRVAEALLFHKARNSQKR